MLAISSEDMVIWVSFKLNQNFIARELCVNRNKPEMHYNSMCFLAKKIAEGVLRIIRRPRSSRLTMPLKKHALRVSFCPDFLHPFQVFRRQEVVGAFVQPLVGQLDAR